MTRGHNGAAPPFMWGSFIPYSMPVYPGAFGPTLLGFWVLLDTMHLLRCCFEGTLRIAGTSP
jgi:hypothetical protein